MKLKTAIERDDIPAMREALGRRRRRFKRGLAKALQNAGVDSLTLNYATDTPGHVRVGYTRFGFVEMAGGHFETLDETFLRGVGEAPFAPKAEPQEPENRVLDPSLNRKARFVADALAQANSTAPKVTVFSRPHVVIDADKAAMMLRLCDEIVASTEAHAAPTTTDEYPFGVSDADVRALTLKTLKAQVAHMAEWFQRSWTHHGGSANENDFTVSHPGFNIMRLKAHQIARLAENLKD